MAPLKAQEWMDFQHCFFNDIDRFWERTSRHFVLLYFRETLTWKVSIKHISSSSKRLVNSVLSCNFGLLVFAMCYSKLLPKAFIPERQRSNNVLIAYEVSHLLKTRRWGKSGNFAFKLDMSKAYNWVELGFLAGMMLHLGFHTDWVTLIMRCVASGSYTVMINRGFGTNWAEDCIIFGYATKKRAEKVVSVISKYEKASSQKVSYDKLFLYFGANIGEGEKGLVGENLRVYISTNLDLGLPMMVDFDQKLKTKICVFYPHEGRSLCQCFVLPKSLCVELENILNWFWWRNFKTLKGIHWSS
ncbi:reverse transcriptase [Gossypium australe]|uniref:Reverse transcriptase n=1 Tax=Gossypium australe TaxID=47621 RepID=A0A5B6WD05_9ROSI|nr:reverse transcriptase [Gossypium australe]